MDDLKDFHVNRVFVEGELVAEEGKYLPEIKKCDIASVKGSVIVKDFSKEKFKMHLKSNTVAHDSHNIIVVGVNDDEMEFAVNSLVEQEGGIVLVKEGKVIESMPMPIAGLMSDQSGEWVDQKLTDIHEKAYEELGICGEVEPVMTLCFMSLAVIPEIKLTDMGLFDVTTFSFIPVEVE